jgi:hypothetical protein
MFLTVQDVKHLAWKMRALPSVRTATSASAPAAEIAVTLGQNVLLQKKNFIPYRLKIHLNTTHWIYLVHSANLLLVNCLFFPKPAKPGPKCKIIAVPLLCYVVCTTFEYTWSKCIFFKENTLQYNSTCHIVAFLIQRHAALLYSRKRYSSTCI